MSLYPPSHSYGQAPFAQQGYTQRGSGPAPGSYQYQPPPPVYQHYDPNSFREDYLSRLAQLTINSRPMIQSLSMTAQENSRWAEIVAQCIETHIRRASPWMKLPAFYLLDAISKNVFEPYARHFTPFVIPLFLETYEQVDQATRSKMEEMLLTWRTGSPHGKELFGIAPQMSIERAIWGGGDTSFGSDVSRNAISPISKAQVLSELDFTLGQRERALQTNPYDTTSQNQANVLRQLRMVVEAGVSQEELHDVLNQLRTLTRAAPPPPAPPAQPPVYVQPQPPAASYPLQPTYPVSAPPSSYPGSSTQPSTYAQPMYDQKPIPSSIPAFPAVSNQNPGNAGPSAPPISNIENLFSALLKAGVVSATGTPTGAGATAKAEEVKSEPVDIARVAARDYRKAVLGQKIRLTNADITRQRPQIVQFLYERLGVQCKQCGIRFSDSASGKKKMQDHLDMHFRQNRKASQNVGRGHSRSWFVGVDDWINEVSDSKGKGRADRPLSGKAAAAVAAQQEEANLRASFVVVPPGDEAKPISCPICKEILKSEFLEDDEEWVWKNAVQKDDRIFHATCYAEALASNRVAAILRNEKTGRSRSQTPEGASFRTTPPRPNVNGVDMKSGAKNSAPPTPDSKLTGTKRKIADDVSAPVEGDGTPPFKKLALSASA
ncbi:hypothetical protein JAAARDRAFT_118249 [Jaapia argillacea MUCL 33604]|uniref:CID domain-containing protein n=1 Tax=Jaapia argillacea MUCL 33604 TaxID=933084 RepID=A0A067QC08_9AGAM|nr:hypothetical protein JAAARDRAFT_118249 [Jaapia argillacea MUCL 33604]